MSQFDAVFAAASQLSVEDRLRLIEQLASATPDDGPINLSPEWLAEIERRSAEIDAGTVKTIPWETVRKSLFESIAAHRAD